MLGKKLSHQEYSQDLGKEMKLLDVILEDLYKACVFCFLNPFLHMLAKGIRVRIIDPDIVELKRK